jgi:hypothetical protein
LIDSSVVVSVSAGNSNPKHDNSCKLKKNDESRRNYYKANNKQVAMQTFDPDEPSVFLKEGECIATEKVGPSFVMTCLPVVE